MNETKILTVVGKNSNLNIKNFDTLEEFQNYYSLHKDEIDKLSTNKINRMFKIKDYKITRRTIDNAEEKTLCFRQLFKNEIENHEHEHEENENEIENTLSELNERIKQLELDNTKIKKQLIEIITVMNSGN